MPQYFFRIFTIKVVTKLEEIKRTIYFILFEFEYTSNMTCIATRDVFLKSSVILKLL